MSNRIYFSYLENEVNHSFNHILFIIAIIIYILSFL